MQTHNTNAAEPSSPARKPVRNRRRRWGTSTVEVAITLGILLNLTFGSIEFGYYFFVKHTLMGAAREGARAAICSGSTNALVTAAVDAEMSAAKLGSSGYTVTTTPTDVSTATTGAKITVTVSCTWGTAGAGLRPLGLISSTKVVTASAVMRDEW